jgi:hypothetical protein
MSGHIFNPVAQKKRATGFFCVIMASMLVVENS